MTARTPTPQGISRLLAGRGFPHAEGRGSDGFSASRILQGDGIVRVRHWFPSAGGRPPSTESGLRSTPRPSLRPGTRPRLTATGAS